MISYFRKALPLAVYALLHDEAKFRRWARGAVGAVAVSGALWADQIEPFAGHRAAVALRVVAILCSIGAALHGDAVTQPAVEQ